MLRSLPGIANAGRGRSTCELCHVNRSIPRSLARWALMSLQPPWHPAPKVIQAQVLYRIARGLYSRDTFVRVVV
jgi:hypothetical protein